MEMSILDLAFAQSNAPKNLMLQGDISCQAATSAQWDVCADVLGVGEHVMDGRPRPGAAVISENAGAVEQRIANPRVTGHTELECQFARTGQCTFLARAPGDVRWRFSTGPLKAVLRCDQLWNMNKGIIAKALIEVGPVT